MTSQCPTPCVRQADSPIDLGTTLNSERTPPRKAAPRSVPFPEAVRGPVVAAPRAQVLRDKIFAMRQPGCGLPGWGTRP